MRRLTLALVALVVLAAGGGLAWRFLRPHDRMAEARQLMSQGNARAAALVLRQLVQDDPGRAEAHWRLAQTDLRLGDPVAAERELRAALDHGWDEHAVRPWLAQAMAAQIGGAGGADRAGAIVALPTEGLTPPQTAILMMARAQALRVLRQPDAARAAAAEARRLAPDSLDIALAAARLAIALGDLGAAERDIGTALALDPQALEALVLQAELRAGQGDRAGALARYDQAATRAGSLGQAAVPVLDGIRLARAGLHLAAGQDAAAATDIDAVLADQPRNPFAQFLKAQSLARAGNWRAADAAVSAIGENIARLQADRLVAVIKANVGQPEQAIAAATRAVARNPGDLAAAKLLARLDLAQGRPAEAAEALARATGPGGATADSEALDLLGQALAGTGQTAPALAALQKAVQLAPEDTRLLTRLAAIEAAAGDAPRAADTLQRVLDATASAATQTATPPAAAPAATPPAAASAAPTPGQDTQAGQTTAQRAATALVVTALQAGEIDRAEAALARLGQSGADPAQQARLGGMIRMARLDLAGARAAFEKSAQLAPPGSAQNAAARIDLARVLILSNHDDDAAAELQSVLAAAPSNVAALTALVNLRLSLHQPDDAIAAAEAAHRAAPDNPSLTAGLADLHTRLGQPAKALAVLAPALQPSSEAAAAPVLPAPVLLAAKLRAALAAGQQDDALATLRLLIARSPQDAALRRQAARLLAGRRDFAGARAILHDGSIPPSDPVLLGTDIAIAGQEGGPEAAIARARAIARDVATPAAQALLGDTLMSTRHFGDAAAFFAGLRAGLPKDAPIAEAAALAVRQADALASGGDATGAAAPLRDILARDATEPHAALALSSLEIGQRRLDAARGHLETVLASQPNNATALNNLAWIEQQQGQLDAARRRAQRAYLLDPTPQAADTLGWIVLAQNQVPAALALLREAATALDDAGVQYHFAAALARAGERDAARATLKALLAKPAAFDEKPQAASLLRSLGA